MKKFLIFLSLAAVAALLRVVFAASALDIILALAIVGVAVGLLSSTGISSGWKGAVGVLLGGMLLLIFVPNFLEKRYPWLLQSWKDRAEVSTMESADKLDPNFPSSLAVELYRRQIVDMENEEEKLINEVKKTSTNSTRLGKIRGEMEELQKRRASLKLAGEEETYDWVEITAQPNKRAANGWAHKGDLVQAVIMDEDGPLGFYGSIYKKEQLPTPWVRMDRDTTILVSNLSKKEVKVSIHLHHTHRPGRP